MMPKTEKSVKKAFESCNKKKVFVSIDKESYLDYVTESLEDLNSAQKELDEGDLKWAVVKAYQSLFLYCTAVLVKNLGIYSKDHGCLIIALLEEKVVKNDILERISSLLEDKQSLYDEVERIRLFRNKMLYFPKSSAKFGNKNEVLKIIEEVRQLISVLGEGL